MAPTKSRTLVEQVADRIRAAIIRGELPSGEPLRQAELAARFGVSPTPLREALRLLEAERFVILHPFRGAVVTAPSPQELRELLEMFLALQTTALEIAIPRLTEERLEQAEGMLREMRATASYEAWGALCVRLLLALCEPACRPRLLETVRAILVSISRYWLFEARWRAHREGWETQAGELLGACRRRDVADAVRIFGTGTSTAVEGVIGQLEERDARLRPRSVPMRRRRSSPPEMP